MQDTQYNSVAACTRFEDELPGYLEGESRPFVVSHSRDCTACGALLADLQSIRESARSLPPLEPSASLWSRIHTQLEAEKTLRIAACSQFETELEAYLEGESRPFVESHARQCEFCGAVLEDLQVIRKAAHDLPQVEPSPAMWASLRSQLDAEGAFRLAACRRFDGDLAAHLEGASQPFVLSHAGECSSCGALLADLEAIHEAAGNLPASEPSPVVWANVRATLADEGVIAQPAGSWRQIFSWKFLPQLIPVGVLAGLVFLAAALSFPSASIERWGAVLESTQPSNLAQLASALPTGEEGSLATVVSDLETKFRANEASMAPDLKATYEKSLISLDGSIKECLVSLRQEPSNTLAHEYLMTAYTRKAEVLSSALEFDGR